MNLTVPVWTVTDENRDEYTRLLRACGADRVFLVVPGVADYRVHGFGDRELIERNVTAFHSLGWEVILWVSFTVGHGGKTVPPDEYRPGNGFDFQPLCDMNGDPIVSTNCPLDGAFRKATREYMRLLAGTSADGLLLDDDYRLSMHGGSASISCACPLHLARIGKYLGREVGLPEVRAGVLHGGPNGIRSAFLRAQGDSLRELAREIREAVDTVDPRKRIGLCSCVSLWNADGADGEELSLILAGKNTKPLLRTMGAPYWASVAGRTLSEMTEISRSMAALSYGKGIELLPEGDVYPRPSNVVPAAFLEAWDALTRADGTYDGAFKYMFVYDEEPSAEPRYLAAHLADKELLEKITDLGKTTSPAGVFVKNVPHTAQDADLGAETFSPLTPRPVAGTFLCEAGIPASYLPTAEGPVAAFGSNARYLTEEEKKRPLILDAVAAGILTRQGVDVGLSSAAEFSDGVSVGKVYDTATGFGCLARHDTVSLLLSDLRSGAHIEAEVSVGQIGLHEHADGRFPFAYTYENADGGRFFVLTVRADGIGKGASLFSNHTVGAVLRRAMTFFGTAPAVTCPSAPNHLALTVRKTKDGAAVVFVNLGADRVTEPTFTLSDSYSRAKFFGCGGELSADGRSFTLSAPIEAYRFGYVRLFD